MNDLQVTSVPLSSDWLYIDCSAIKRQNPIYSSAETSFLDVKSILTVRFDFRNCIRGEIYKELNQIWECKQCSDGTYSIVIPD